VNHLSKIAMHHQRKFFQQQRLFTPGDASPFNDQLFRNLPQPPLPFPVELLAQHVQQFQDSLQTPANNVE
jgi:hypothetical protein